MRDWGPFVQPCGWAEAPPMPQGKLLLANPSRGPFKKGWCFSLARGTPPSRISLEAETALRARFQQQQQLRGQSEVRRSGGGFYVTVEEEAGLGGDKTFFSLHACDHMAWDFLYQAHFLDLMFSRFLYVAADGRIFQSFVAETYFMVHLYSSFFIPAAVYGQVQQCGSK
nr:uncharacterized protein LOC105499832 isoform X8 [Macaca nemestrina]